MSRFRFSLRWAGTAVAFLAVMGFGVTQAFAAPEAARALRQCNPQNPADNICNEICPCGGACNIQTMRCTCFACDA